MFTVNIRPFPGTPTTFNSTTPVTLADALSRANQEYNVTDFEVKLNGVVQTSANLDDNIDTDATIRIAPAKGKVKGNK